MKKIIDFKLLVLFFCACFINAYSSQEALNNWPCTYLDPEIVHRINEKEIKTIVEIGSSNGLNAIHLSRHYKCPTFVCEINDEHLSIIKETISSYPYVTVIPLQFYTEPFDNWMGKINSASIDLLCVNVTDSCLSVLQNAGKNLDSIKYILIPNEPSLYDSKEYLNAQGFRSYFDGVSLFKHVIFINKRMKNSKMDSQFLRDFNTPDPSPMLPGNAGSELIYAAGKGDQAFHELTKIDINYQDANGNTALMSAIAHDHLYAVIKLLQQAHLDPGLQNKNGCTALITAAALGRAHVAQLLLDDPRAMSTVDIVNNMGMDAQETARLVRAAEIADLIHSKKSCTVRNDSLEYTERVIPEKVLICGVCKDVSQFLPDMIKIFEKIGNLFEDYRIVVYENDSTDGTQAILREWMHTNEKVTVQFESISQAELAPHIINRDENGELNRIELIARARNKLLDTIMASAYDSFPSIIMMDMDFISAPPPDSIIEVFHSKREWDAVFAYGIGGSKAYWDWYAFRDFNQPFGPELLGNDWFIHKVWSLTKTDQWCPVYSAFGGLGIYKRASIEGCRYSALVTPDLEKLVKQIINRYKPLDHPVVLNYLNDSNHLNKKATVLTSHPCLPEIKEIDTGILLSNDSDTIVWRMNSGAYSYPIVCEHVSFHAAMIQKGKGNLFINPRLVLTYTR